MSEAEDIEAIRALLERHGIAEFEYEADGVHLQLRFEPKPELPPFVEAPAYSLVTEDLVTLSVAATTAPAKRPSTTITAPHVGIFLENHPLEHTARPLPRRVAGGEIIGLLKAGAALRPVLAPADGVVAKMLVAPGTLVGHGAALFVFHRTGE